MEVAKPLQISVTLLILAVVVHPWGKTSNGALAAPKLSGKDREVVGRFQSYLQIDSAQPSPDYYPATKFLVEQGKELGLDVKVVEYVEKKPVVVLSWKGKDPPLPSILLNSHMDVVPADFSKWTYPPFSAHIDEDGKIFARGSQDMKCVGMQYLEAIRELKAAGFQPRRSIHVSFVPDEEIGGKDGAEKFVQSEEFRDLGVGVALDEGLASPGDLYRLFYGERSVWWLAIKATGAPAHGSRLFDGMAVHNLRETLNKIDEFRTSQFEKVKSGECAEGEVVSVNNVFLKAGVPTPTGFVMNVQPSEAEAGFDMRLPPIVDISAIEKLLTEEWAPASRNLTYSFIQKNGVMNKYGEPAVTATDDSNPWWKLIQAGVANAGGNLGRPEIFMASTDARFSRYEGIPVFGFSPMANTPILLHDHNEFLHVNEYLKGISVYVEVIKSLAGASASEQGDAIHTEL